MAAQQPLLAAYVRHCVKIMIRTYRESDREALKEITATCFGRASSIDHNIEMLFGLIDGKDWAWRKKRHIDDDIRANASGIFVAEIDGSTIGFVTTRLDHASKVGWIPNIAVLPAHREKRIGRALMNAAIAYLRDHDMVLVRIETLEANAAGRHFYPSYGFKEVARQIHYAMPIDAT